MPKNLIESLLNNLMVHGTMRLWYQPGISIPANKYSKSASTNSSNKNHQTPITDPTDKQEQSPVHLHKYGKITFGGSCWATWQLPLLGDDLQWPLPVTRWTCFDHRGAGVVGSRAVESFWESSEHQGGGAEVSHHERGRCGVSTQTSYLGLARRAYDGFVLG